MGCNYCKKPANSDETTDVLTNNEEEEDDEKIKNVRDSPKMHFKNEKDYQFNLSPKNINTLNLTDSNREDALLQKKDKAENAILQVDEEDKDKVVKTEVLDSIVTTFEKGNKSFVLLLIFLYL